MSVDVPVPAADAILTARLTVPPDPLGVVLVSVVSKPRDLFTVALLDAGFAVLRAEMPRPGDSPGQSIRVADIAPRVDCLVTLTRWARGNRLVGDLPLGYFATGAAAAVAMGAAAELGGEVAAVVLSQGRLDLVRSCVASVTAATLLIVGGADPVALDRNGGVEPLLRCPSALEIVPSATHRFVEPGALDQVVGLSVAWFRRFLGARTCRAGCP